MLPVLPGRAPPRPAHVEEGKQDRAADQQEAREPELRSHLEQGVVRVDPDRVDAREPACADAGQRVVAKRAPRLAPDRVPAVGDVAPARILAAADEDGQRTRDVLARHELRDEQRGHEDGNAEQ